MDRHASAPAAHRPILALLATYFDGLYTGDTELLRSVFDPEVSLFAMQDGQLHHNRLENWLSAVAARKSPREMGEVCRMRVLSLDVINNMAMAMVHVPARGRNYFNYLSLLQQGGRWQIVNKTFDDVPPA